MRGLANECFKSYLSNKKQHVSINGYDSNLADLKFGVPQCSVFGPLLFLIYIKDTLKAYFCQRHSLFQATILSRLFYLL